MDVAARSRTRYLGLAWLEGLIVWPDMGIGLEVVDQVVEVDSAAGYWLALLDHTLGFAAADMAADSVH